MNRAKYRARIVRDGRTPAAFLDTDLRDDYDRRMVLLALYDWIKRRLYLLPSTDALADKRKWPRQAVHDVLGDLTAMDLVTYLPGEGWAITTAGSALLQREHVVPLLPSALPSRKRMAVRLFRITQDLKEFEALRTHLGLPDYQALYRRLYHSGSQT